MRTKVCTLALIFIALSVACTRQEGTNPDQIREWRQFIAHTERGDATKTLLDGEVGDPQRAVKWSPDDTIGITCQYSFEKFSNMGDDTSSTAIFQGYIKESERYYAIYPYSEKAYLSSGEMSVYLPPTQIFCEGSFGPGVNPMVANIIQGEELDFHNICGLLILRVRGDFAVKSISFEAKDSLGAPMGVAGYGYVDMNYEESPVLVMNSNANTLVSIECEDGVALSSGEDTHFHLVLPPATYNSFRITIVSTDGRIFIKDGTKPLTISRSVATKSGSFIPEEAEFVDLSIAGTANSYIVSSEGGYTIDATVMGNGTDGISDEVYLHTGDLSISPVSAEVLWVDGASPAVAAATYDKENKVIKFFATGSKGNALIAAKDGDGNILWSWHIWCTDVPTIHKYDNGSEISEVMDRNLGATRADRGEGEEWKESCGLEYQWGKKDPMAGGCYEDISGDNWSIEQSILNPTLRYERWKMEEQTWHPDFKTIYDPCPLGYRVAPYSIWYGFSIGKVSGEFDHGWNFQYDSDGNTAWYPTRGRPTETDIDYWTDNYMISSSGVADHRDGIYFNSGSFRHIYNEEGPLRCVVDKDVERRALPIVSVKRIDNITANSVRVVGEVVDEGASDVTERGIIVGSVFNLTKENGTTHKSGIGGGEFVVDINNLSPGTKYYLRGYAINEQGLNYSQVESFTTEVEGDIFNLSLLGKANCYLITDNGFRDFIFDARYQGNTEISVGTPTSAEVLWETKSVEDTISKGDVISSVSLREDGFVQFSIPNTFTAGNALVAVRDADSTILWSWHIWVSEQISEHAYNGDAGIFKVMDRNLGAIRADKGVGEQWRDALGMMYQWGRKDPLVKDLVTISNEMRSSVNYYHSHPTEFGYEFPNIDDFNNSLWRENEKYKNDPCPVGYRVASVDALSTLQLQETGYDKGRYLLYDGLNSVWYPATPYYDPTGYYNNMKYSSYIWTDRGVMSLYITNDDKDMVTWRSAGDSYPVRCMVDGDVMSEMPNIIITDISDATSSSITVWGKLTSQGASKVTECGFILGKREDVAVDNAIASYKRGDDSDILTHTFTGLEEYGRYYIKGYAVNEFGISYTKAYPFVTLFTGELIDLSKDESANSYIVSSVGRYKFKLVKGNSGEAVPEGGEPKLLWETFNNDILPHVGDLVNNVRYDRNDGYIYFDVYAPFVEGNASIGYSYSHDYGRCWSWHIWLTDLPQGQTYPNGATLMDRNLGATSTKPGDVEALGLMYQWGRKDPFLNSSSTNINVQAQSTLDNWDYYSNGTMDDAIVYPTKFYKRNQRNSDWLYTGDASTDTSRWGVDKTVYDPCPPGWKVATGGDNGVWTQCDTDSLIFDNINKGVSIPLGSDGAEAWYPATGYRHPDNSRLEKVGKYGSYWTSDFGDGAPHGFFFNSGGYFYPEDLKSAAYGQSVRCQKIE